MSSIIKALSNDKHIRLIVCDICDIIDKISQIHNLTGKNKKLFSDSAIGTVLLGSDLKSEGTNISAVLRSVSSSISAVVLFDAQQSIRGYFKAGSDQNEGFEAMNGDGSLTVMCDDGKVGLYTSTIPLNSTSMEASFSDYLHNSQQHEGLLHLSEQRSVGIMIQPVLNSEISYVNERRDELMGMMNEIFVLNKSKDIRNIILQHGFHILTETNAHWSCNCNRKKMQGVVLSLGRDEANAILDEIGKIEIACPYCKTKYEFDRIQTEELFNANER